MSFPAFRTDEFSAALGGGDRYEQKKSVGARSIRLIGRVRRFGLAGYLQ
jgi:hypothetical protein